MTGARPSGDESRTVLYLMVCGAAPADHIRAPIELAQTRGWSVYCVVTPTAVEHFLDVDALAELTGNPVRTGHQRSGQPAIPDADAVVVAPATYNTINKWAAGIADTYVTTQLAELTGLGVPTVAVPFVNTALAANSAFQSSVQQLRACGVEVLFAPGVFEPHPPRAAQDALDRFPWKAALDAVE